MTTPFEGRVFCVGMNKTGTSSMHRCFAQLGLHPVACPASVHRVGLRAEQRILDHGDYEPALKLAVNFRSFEDRPWNVGDIYQRLDERFPESRFILTVRRPELWWRSVEHWISVTKPHVAKRYCRNLGVPSINADAMIAAYLSYNERVRAYFTGTGKLLVMDLEAGDGWAPLCAFLGMPVPETAFPHANRQAYTEADRVSRRGQQRLHRKQWSCGNCGTNLPKPAPAPALTGVRLKLQRLLERAHRVHAHVTVARRGTPVRRAERIRRRLGNGGLDGLVAASCYFNPCRYRRRYENFRAFVENLRESGIPLLTVELAIGQQDFQLDADCGDVLRVRSPDVMWHKERLLNLGIARWLERGCSRIVWLDGDVAFTDTRTWPWYVAEALENYPVCQVFSHHFQAMDERGGGRPGLGAMYYFQKTGWRVSQPSRRPTLRNPLARPLGFSGFGWAARANVLRQVPLYDGAILGGGDRIIYAASLPTDAKWEPTLRELLRAPQRCAACGHRNESPAYTDHVLRWARQWAAATGGPAGLVVQRIRDSFHGAPAHKGYRWRKEILFKHAFDPVRDLALDDEGCWRWSGASPKLRQDVAEYFLSRAEDS